MPTTSDVPRGRGLPPKSPAAQPAGSLPRPSSGVWAPVRDKLQLRPGSYPGGIGQTQSQSSSDIDGSNYEDSRALSSRPGGGSIAQGRLTGTGQGGGEEEAQSSYSGRYGYALSSYDQINKPRPHWEIVAEVVSKGATMPKKRLVPLLRELCIRIGDNTVCDGALFGALLNIIRSAKEGDWDGKTVRLVHFFVRGMVTAQGDTDGRMLGSHWEGRGITPRQILEAVECFREESEHRSALRKSPAFQTIATLCQLAAEARIGGQTSPIEVLRDATLAPLQSFQAQERPEKGGKGRAQRQRLEAFNESLQVSASIFSALRRCPSLARDRAALPSVLSGCCSENSLAARHSFALLADQAAANPAMVSQALLKKGMLLPTTVGMLQAPGGPASSGGEEPNLGDSLACVYYLRALKALAFAQSLDNTMRLDTYRTMVSSVSDARHRVALEAMQCLLDHPRAWQLLVDAQRESRDVDIFRRVVDRIKLCVEEATSSPASAGSGDVSAAAGSTGSTAGASRASVMDTAPQSATGGGGAAEQGVEKSREQGGTRCNWALAHAACRVCRVVGRTFQVAISYQTIQSQNRDQSATVTPKGAAAALRRGGSGAPFVGARSDLEASGQGDGGGGEPFASLDASTGSGTGGGSVFNLLGLPPSPPSRSGIMGGASAWSGGVRTIWENEITGDVMAGQVVEEQNTAAIRDLCKTLQQHKLLESPHLHVRSLALEAMFLLVPDPSPVDPQLRGLWDWLQQKVAQCPSTLPDSVLSELVDTLLTRVHCSAASREEVIPIALALTESFMCQVQSDEMGRCLLRAWCQCVVYGGRSREAVLQSVYRVLDWNVSVPTTALSVAVIGRSDGITLGDGGGGQSPAAHTRRALSEDWTRLTVPVARGGEAAESAVKPSSSVSPSEESHPNSPDPQTVSTDARQQGMIASRMAKSVSRIGSRDGGLKGGSKSRASVVGKEEAPRRRQQDDEEEHPGGPKESPRLAYLKARGTWTRLKRSAFWFLGEYCCPLTGTRRDRGTPKTIRPEPDPSGAVDHGQAATAETGVPGKGVAGQGDTSSALVDLLGVWTNTPGNSRDDAAAVEVDTFSAGIPPSGSAAATVVTDLRGIEDEAGSKAIPHQVVAAMNSATVSMLLRLKHAAMFEDLQTRHTCASALCKIALRFAEPVRFDVYCFLKGLSHAADIFPVLALDDQPEVMDVTVASRWGVVTEEPAIEEYWREQEEFAEKLEAAGAFGIADVVTPVLDYLDCFYVSAGSQAPSTAKPDAEGSSETLLSTSLLGDDPAKPTGGVHQPPMSEESLELYRRLLDNGQGAAAPGP